MRQSSDVVIVGGGMVGATLASLLGQAGLRVVVLEERAPRPFEPGQPLDLRVSALNRASCRVFDSVGALEPMLNMRACRFRGIAVFDAEGSGEARFHADETGIDYFGYFIENRLIQLAMVERLQALPGVEWRCPAAPVDLEWTGSSVRVHLDDGDQLEAALVVGADGARSRVREAAGIEAVRHDYQQHALVANVRTRLPQQDCSWQRFCATGPQAFLPLPGSHACLVWYHAPDAVRHLEGLSDEAFRHELETAFPPRLGGVEAVLGRASFPIRRSHARRYFGPRVVLVGDAAHTIHPLAGQGLNLGIADAAVLARALVARRRADPGDPEALARYESRRRPANLAMMTTMDAFHYAFSSRLDLTRRLRNVGLKWADRATPAKRLVMRCALGETEGAPVG